MWINHYQCVYLKQQAVSRACVQGGNNNRMIQKYSNTWKLLSIQRLIPAQRVRCICTEGEEVCAQAVLPSVWPKVSPVDYVTQQWLWPFTVRACSKSWKAYKHASLPLFPHSPTRIDIVPLANTGLQYVFISTNGCPSSCERQIKTKPITPKCFNRACHGTKGFTHWQDSVSLRVCEDKKRWLLATPR